MSRGKQFQRECNETAWRLLVEQTRLIVELSHSVGEPLPSVEPSPSAVELYPPRFFEDDTGLYRLDVGKLCCLCFKSIAGIATRSHFISACILESIGRNIPSIDTRTGLYMHDATSSAPLWVELLMCNACDSDSFGSHIEGNIGSMTVGQRFLFPGPPRPSTDTDSAVTTPDPALTGCSRWYRKWVAINPSKFHPTQCHTITSICTHVPFGARCLLQQFGMESLLRIARWSTT